MEKEFAGDVKLLSTPDGGDLLVENGLVAADSSIGTAAYLSLFGGNRDDDGKTENANTWWGNLLSGVKPNEKMVSRFQNVIAGLPLTAKNIAAAETAARLDLAWFVEEGAADEIAVSSRVEGRSRFLLAVDLRKNGASEYSGEFAAEWGGAGGV